MAAATARACFQYFSTRKDFFSSISAAKQPTTLQRMTNRDMGKASVQLKKAAVHTPKHRPTQKATPYRNRGRTRGTATTSPADSTWRRW